MARQQPVDLLTLPARMTGVHRLLGPFLVALLLIPSAAVAHSDVVETNPADGAILETLPADATVTLNEAPATAHVVLAGPDGTVHKLRSRVSGSTITARLPSTGPRGAYTLSYRVVSADGHPISGSSTFTVTTGSAPAPATPQGSPTAAEPAPSAAGDRGLLVPIVIGIALVGVVASIVVARSLRR